jgi:hypothetical protein
MATNLAKPALNFGSVTNALVSAAWCCAKRLTMKASAKLIT